MTTTSRAYWVFRVLVACAISGAMGPFAKAQTLDEIIVYGQKGEQSLKALPFSISVLSADYIEQRRFQTLEQLTAFQPGVDISKNSGASKVFVRGIGSQGNAGLEQSAATFVDGTYFGRSRSTKSALVDLKQLEILKGPQSVLLGVNSSAGAIAITTRGATLDESSGYAEFNAGNYGETGGLLAYNYQISEAFALRGVVSANQSDGFWNMVDPLSGEVMSTNTGGDSQLYRLSGVWQPTDNLRARFKAERQSIDRDNPFAWQPGGCGNLYGLGLSTQSDLDAFWQATGSAQDSPLSLPFTCEEGFADNEFDRRSPAAPFNSSAFDTENLQARLNWNFGSVELTSITSAYDVDYTFAGNDVTHGAPGVSRFLFARDDYQQVSQELRLASEHSRRLQWLVGAYWHAGDIDFETGDSDRRSARNPQFIRTAAIQEETVFSAFSALDWQLNSAWTVQAGFRWTRIEKTFSGIDERIRNNTVAQDQRGLFAETLANDVSGNPDAFSVFGREVRNAFEGEQRDFSDVLPSLALSFAPGDRVNFYYRWSEGYKAGGFNFRLNGLDETSLDFDAETVSAHEIGVKFDRLDQNLSIAAAIFVSDYQDLQQNSNRGDDGLISAAVIRNAAAASSDGIEVELSWRPIEPLRIDWSATFLDAQFDDYQGSDCTRLQSVVSRTDVAEQFGAERVNNRCSQDLSGGRLAHAPEVSSRAALTYSPALSDRFFIDGTFEWFYSDGFFTSPHADPLRRQAAFHKFNARISLHSPSGRWAIDVIATNLTNELTARQLGQDEDAAVSGLVDDPRRFGVRLRYSL